MCVRGTPAASDPQDPEYNDGSILDGSLVVDMPLYRVPLDGISVGDPEPLFETIPSLADLRDPVSHRVSNQCLCVTCGPMAVVMVDLVASSSPYVFTTVGTLPDSVRPAAFPTSENVICSTLVYRGSGNAGGMLQVTGEGVVRVYTPSADKYYSGQIVFPLAR